MKTLKSVLNTLVLASTVLCSAVALAGSPSTENVTLREGGVNGGGGDLRCIEYSNMVGQIALAFNQMGQAKVSQMSNLIKVNELWNVKIKLRCIPEKNMPRQAWSIPRDALTKLDADVWEKLSKNKKIRLAVHELAVLAGYENDGEYFMSDVMMGLLQKNSPAFADSGLIVELIDEETSGSFFLQSKLEKQAKKNLDGKCERNEIFKLEKFETIRYEEQEDYETLASGTYKVSYRCIPVE